MPSIKFYQKKNAKFVLVNISYHQKRLQLSAKISIEPALFAKICPNKLLNFRYSHTPEYKYLKALQDFILEAYNQALSERKILPESQLKALINDFLNPQEAPENKKSPEKYFWETFREFMQGKKRDNVSYHTESNYKGLQKHLLEFSEKTRFKLSFEAINRTFIDNLSRYFLEAENPKPNRKSAIGYTNDTIDKYLRNLKAFLKWSYERGFHTNTEYIHIKPKRSPNVDKPVLEPEDFLAILNVDTSDNKDLDLTKDILTILVFSGQRISDVLAFNKSDIEGIGSPNPIWHIMQKKTKAKVQIPLKETFFEPLFDVLQKHNFQLPYFTANGINKGLKELAKLAGLTEMFKSVSMIGNKTIITEKPVYECMSTHIGRRTFITYALSEGVPPNIVMRISGHKKLDTLQKYDKTQIRGVAKAFKSKSFLKQV